MHASVAISLVALAACGRVGFGAELPVDAPADQGEHDEDGDGRPDALDRCPHVVDDNADMDADGVGDACDPNPTTPTESLAVFATMMPGDQPFLEVAAWSQQADALRFAGTSTSLELQHPISNARIELGFEIHGLTAFDQHQVAFGIDGVPYYFAELDEKNAGATRNAQLVEYTDTSGYVALATQTHAGMHPGIGFLRLDADADNRQLELVTGWIGELYNAGANAPSYVGGPTVNFAFNGLDLSLRYLVVIATM